MTYVGLSGRAIKLTAMKNEFIVEIIIYLLFIYLPIAHWSHKYHFCSILLSINRQNNNYNHFTKTKLVILEHSYASLYDLRVWRRHVCIPLLRHCFHHLYLIRFFLTSHDKLKLFNELKRIVRRKAIRTVISTFM